MSAASRRRSAISEARSLVLPAPCGWRRSQWPLSIVEQRLEHEAQRPVGILLVDFLFAHHRAGKGATEPSAAR
jgi:hypothetical protein